MNPIWHYMYSPLARDRITIVPLAVYAVFILGLAIMIVIKEKKEK
ncbi:hypothetical protein [Gottschalkia acidurici]|nr:hypothetical protein [Gottschalkia acidurici]